MKITKIGYQASQKINNFQDLEDADDENKHLYIIALSGFPIDIRQDVAKAKPLNVSALSKCTRWIKSVLRLPTNNNPLELKFGTDIQKAAIQRNDPYKIQNALDNYIKKSKNFTPVWMDRKKAKEYNIALQYEYMKRVQQVANLEAKKMSEKRKIPIKKVRVNFNYLPLPQIQKIEDSIPRTKKAYNKYKQISGNFY